MKGANVNVRKIRIQLSEEMRWEKENPFWIQSSYI